MAALHDRDARDRDVMSSSSDHFSERMDRERGQYSSYDFQPYRGHNSSVV